MNTATKRPSEEFLAAVKDYKLTWGKDGSVWYDETKRDGKMRTKKHNLIMKLGLKGGLSKKFIQDRVWKD